jgi:hypothetical protein
MATNSFQIPLFENCFCKNYFKKLFLLNKAGINMKKIYFVSWIVHIQTQLLIIFFIIILSLLSKETAFSQNLGCDNIEPPFNECYAPWRWFVQDVPYVCDGVTYSARVTFCAYCDITNNRVCIRINRVENLPAGCNIVDVYDEQIIRWLFEENHIIKFCGNYPCGTIPPQRYHLKFPACVDIIYIGVPNRYTIQASPDCNKFCYWDVESCWCNCTPDCDPDPSCTPHMFYTVKSYFQIGTGYCEPQGVSREPFTKTTPFTINCIKMGTYCDKEGWYWVP